MKILLFLLGTIFFFIFFLFSRLSSISEPLFSNLYIEAHIYIAFSLLFIATLINGNRKKKLVDEDYKENNKIFSKEDTFLFIKKFFGKYIYYIACSFFYMSLFLVFQAILGEINIPKILLFFNIIVISLYFIEHKFTLFQDLLRVNTIIISLYYIVLHLLYLGDKIEVIFIEDIINIVLIFVLFFLFFTSSRAQKHLPILHSYALSFFFLELCVVIKYIYNDLEPGISILSLFLGIIFLLGTDIIHKYLNISKKVIRFSGIIFSYIFISGMSIQLFYGDSLHIGFVPIIILFSWILFQFHNRFQNYISLLFSSYAFTLSLYVLYHFFLNIKLESLYLFVFFFCISGFFLLIDKIYRTKYIYDTYFFHIFSIIVNLCGVISFFFFWDISILNIGILLFGESMYFFFSYYTLHNISRGGSNTH